MTSCRKYPELLACFVYLAGSSISLKASDSGLIYIFAVCFWRCRRGLSLSDILYIWNSSIHYDTQTARVTVHLEKKTFVGIQYKFCVNIHLIVLKKEPSVNTLWMCAGMLQVGWLYWYKHPCICEYAHYAMQHANIDWLILLLCYVFCRFITCSNYFQSRWRTCSFCCLCLGL